MHLEIGPHPLLYNSPFFSFSTGHTCSEPRPDSPNRYSSNSKAHVLAANQFLTLKQQICASCTSYDTSYLAFRKPELCLLEGSTAVAMMPTFTSPPAKLMPCSCPAFPEPCKIL